MFILTIDCTSKSTNEYNNLKNDKIIKLENDSSNNSNTQQKTTTNEVKNKIIYEFKQPVQVQSHKYDNTGNQCCIS